MPVKVGARKRIEHMRERVESRFLNDYCSCYKLVRVPNGYGGYTEQLGDPLLYKNSELIPCRLDPTAHYRQTDIFEQEAIVNEYTLRIPIDAPIEPDHIVVISGLQFQVRKIMEYHTDGVAKTALVSIVE